MKNFFFLIACLSGITSINAQIVGDCGTDYDTASELVEILVGEGVDFSNASLSGFDCSAGYFSGSSNLGFETGLVMATDGLGSIGPGGGGGTFGGPGTEPDLELQLDLVNALNNSLNNLIVLEFDFVPTSDTITFEYIFASNEYPSYTCSQYNDIFGFFLSGPDITTGAFGNNALNLAMVPDPNNPGQYTNTPVIINTVNSGTPSGAYPASNCSDIDPNWEDYSVFFTDNSGTATVNYPGFTVPLTATAVVTPCETYHIKLAIADVADGGVNSAVFLKENSFNSNPAIDYTFVPNASNIFNDDSPYVDNLYEGCGTSSIIFNRPPEIDAEIVFDVTLSGAAQINDDYSVTNIVDNQVVMPVGQPSTIVNFTTFNDGITEGAEDIIIEILPVDYGCYELDLDTFTFDILDQPTMSGDMSISDALCPGDAITLEALPAGGVGGLMSLPYSFPPYTYSWSDGGSNETLTIYPTQSQVSCVTITDVCLQEYVVCEDVQVETYSPLFAITSPDVTSECPGDLATLNVQAFGGMGEELPPFSPETPYTYQWIGYGTSSSQTVSPESDTEYCVEVTDVCGDQVTECMTVEIAVFPPIEGTSDEIYVCEDESDEICVTASGGNGELLFEWSTGETTECIEVYPGVYNVVITDECGKTGSAQGEVLLDSAPEPFWDGYQEPSLEFIASLFNHTPEQDGLTYAWDFGDGQTSDDQDPETHTYPAPGEYWVTLGITTEINDCYKEYRGLIKLAPHLYFYAPNTFSPNGDSNNDVFKPSIEGESSYEIFIYDKWGKEVFTSTDKREYWDGTFDGELANQDTYVYKVVLTKKYEDERIVKTGYVNLLR